MTDNGAAVLKAGDSARRYPRTRKMQEVLGREKWICLKRVNHSKETRRVDYLNLARRVMRAVHGVRMRVLGMHGSPAQSATWEKMPVATPTMATSPAAMSKSRTGNACRVMTIDGRLKAGKVINKAPANPGATP